MNSHDYENSLVDISSKSSDKYFKQIFNKKALETSHKIFNALNISIISLLLIISFLSFDSQNKWTNFYTNLIKIRNINNNLVDYISKTEEFYLDEIESAGSYRRTTSKDLLYLERSLEEFKSNFFLLKMNELFLGIKDGFYQRGY